MASSRPLRSSITAVDPHAPVEGALAFTRLCRERLGCQIPVGSKARGVWYQDLSEEMDIQGWTWEVLEDTVDWIVEQGKPVRMIRGVLHYVEEARRDREERASHYQDSSLQVKVAEALAVETDEYWRRRLSLAQGKKLERVYLEWLRS